MWTRRRMLVAGGAGVVGLAALSPVLFGGGSAARPEPVPIRWFFGPYPDGPLTPVTLPHTVVPLSWRDWAPSRWERLWVYRCTFDAPQGPASDRLFLDIGAALTVCTVYLNGQRVGGHAGGYLPYTVELTGRLQPRGNELAVVVDGRWRADVPPNRPRAALPSTIDFYQPAGMYRAAALRHERAVFLSDVFAEPLDVLDPVRRRVRVQVQLDGTPPATATVRVALRDGTQTVAAQSADLPRGRRTGTVTLDRLPPITLWDMENPRLYTVAVTLSFGGHPVSDRTVRIGFREATFRRDGFFLNGQRVKLFGLNRHQWYPFTGGAMPDRVQRRDAEILRNELNCTMVRCSHYPQSEAFLDACDELGLLVWEEAPGWDYIGDTAWKHRVLRDVRQMVTRDRNHPSIIVWGTRLNETIDEADLYIATDRIAKSLDSTRATTGAVNRAPNDVGPVRTSPSGKATDPYSTTEFSQDVFAYNDYSRPRDPSGKPTLRPPRIDLPYLISEAVGTLIGPPHFRRVDPEHVQAVQGLLHAAVHDDAAADDRYCGLLAWCAFDYPSGWYHAFEGVKWPGVCDLFRIPKLGAAFYRSQVDPATRVVIEPGFYWDFGPRSPRGGPGERAAIFTNCDTLTVSVDGGPARTVTQDRQRFPNLRFPPFLADLAVRGTELRIDGYLGGRLAATRLLSADQRRDRLAFTADDPAITADGVDATRLVLLATDRYGAPRPYVRGEVTLQVLGPGSLVGDNPFPLQETGGAGAVWLRASAPGAITVQARHPRLGVAGVQVTAVG